MHRVDSWQAAIALVACGAGVALVPELALRAHRPGVSILAVCHDEPARNVYAAVRNGSQDAPHIVAVLAALSAAAASRLAAERRLGELQPVTVREEFAGSFVRRVIAWRLGRAAWLG